MSLEAFGVGEGSNTAARRRPRPPNFQQKERESEGGEHGSLLAALGYRVGACTLLRFAL